MHLLRFMREFVAMKVRRTCDFRGVALRFTQRHRLKRRIALKQGQRRFNHAALLSGIVGCAQRAAPRSLGK